jgi:rubredoxin-NAD+ reductase
MPPEAAAALRDALASKGVRWHLECVAASVDHAGEAYRLTLSDGTELEADTVLSAIGLRPRTALAQAAGLAIGRGISVNRHLATSAEQVYALGDCAEVEGLVLPFVMPIMHAGRALAKTLAGEPTPVTYPAMPVVVKTPAWPTVVSPPPAGVEGEWEVSSDSGGVRALFRAAGDALRGFAISGEAAGEKNALTRELPPLLS